jgi:hypothetical protein
MTCLTTVTWQRQSPPTVVFFPFEILTTAYEISLRKLDELTLGPYMPKFNMQGKSNSDTTIT